MAAKRSTKRTSKGKPKARKASPTRKPAARPAKTTPKPASNAVPAATPSAAARRQRAVMAQTEHLHQDPRAVASASKVDPHGQTNIKPTNWGVDKTKGVSRMEHVTNWFRRGRGR